MIKNFRNRLSNVQKALKGADRPAALLLSSAPEKNLSRDTSLPFRQSSDFYYLTGSQGKNLVLLVSSSLKQPLLFAPPVNREKVLWEGKPENAAVLADDLGAELKVTDEPEREILRFLSGTENLFFQNEAGTLAWKIAQNIIARASHERRALPACFSHSDVILGRMRLFKDQSEIECIRKAADVTNAALYEILPLVKSGTREIEIAAALKHFFTINGCSEAFPPIVASGISAATLHYEPSEKKLKNGELLMLDIGAAFNMYAADITRVLPVSGFFSLAQRQVYGFVLEAQKAAIKKVRHGVLIKDVYMAAARVLTEGLKELGLLKGNLPLIRKKQAWRSYFPHSIGHSLGLDTHDIGDLRANQNARLETGMVLTIEPGLYFPKKAGGILPMGIRIEDDVLVTKSGSIVLSEGFPKGTSHIESLF